MFQFLNDKDAKEKVESRPPMGRVGEKMKSRRLWHFSAFLQLLL